MMHSAPLLRLLADLQHVHTLEDSWDATIADCVVWHDAKPDLMTITVTRRAVEKAIDSLVELADRLDRECRTLVAAQTDQEDMI